MATKRDIITQALREINVVAIDEEPAGEYYTQGLTVLNRQLAYLKETDGIEIEAQEASEGMEVGDILPEHEAGATYLLAGVLAPSFNRQDLSALYGQGLRMIRATLFKVVVIDDVDIVGDYY